MNIEEFLGKKILDAYRRTIFSKISKSEIDLIVFDALLRYHMKDEKETIENDEINWLRISSNR